MIYSSTEVYPSEADVDLTQCKNCGFDCSIHDYCKSEAIEDSDKHDVYLNDILKDKGYGGCNLKAEEINGKYWLILYPFNVSATYWLCEKLNVECGIPVVPLKTRYSMGVPGLNVSNCYTKLLEVIDQVSECNDPINSENIVSVEDLFEFVNREYPVTVESCHQSNIKDPVEVINVVDAFEHLGLSIVVDTATGECQGFIVPEGVDVYDSS